MGIPSLIHVIGACTRTSLKRIIPRKLCSLKIKPGFVKSVQSALSDLLTTSATHDTFSRPSTKRGLILIGLELNTNARESFEHCWSYSLNLSIDQHDCPHSYAVSSLLITRFFTKATLDTLFLIWSCFYPVWLWKNEWTILSINNFTPWKYLNILINFDLKFAKELFFVSICRKWISNIHQSEYSILHCLVRYLVKARLNCTKKWRARISFAPFLSISDLSKTATSSNSTRHKKEEGNSERHCGGAWCLSVYLI